VRVAFDSEIHENRAAREAVIAQVRQCAADHVMHGGELVNGRVSLAIVIARIRRRHDPGSVAIRIGT